MLAFGAGQGSPTCMATSQFVQGGIEFAWLESFANFNLLPAFPPVGADVIEYILRLWLGLSLRRAFFCFIFKL